MAGLKVADLYVDIHSNLQPLKDELAGLGGGGDLTGGAPTGGGKQTETETEIADEVESGAEEQAASAALLGEISGTAALGATALLAVGAMVAGIAINVAKTAIANSQLVSMFNTYMSTALGQLFDMLVITLFAIGVGEIGSRMDEISTLWSNFQTLIAPIVDDFRMVIVPGLESLSEALWSNIGPMLYAQGDFFVSQLLPGITAVAGAVGFLLPFLETTAYAVGTVMAPMASLIYNLWTEIQMSAILPMLDVLDALSPTVQKISDFMIFEVFPWFQESIFPAIEVIADIIGSLVAIPLTLLWDSLGLTLVPAFEAFWALAEPVLNFIMDLIGPGIQALLPVLNWIATLTEQAARWAHPSEWAAWFGDQFNFQQGSEPTSPMGEASRSVTEGMAESIPPVVGTAPGATAPGSGGGSTPMDQSPWIQWRSLWDGFSGGWW